MKLADAYVEISTKDMKFKQGLKTAENQLSLTTKKMQAQMKKVGVAVAAMGAAITAALTGAAMKATKLGDQLDKMSKRTGIAVETLSELGYAAQISGSNLDTMEKALRYLARAMDDMSKGMGESKETFEKMNIVVTDTEGNLRNTVEVMKEAATKIANMTNETEQVAAATDLFGSRFGTQLLPLLKEGATGITALTDRAKELGIVMSTEDAASAAEFNDRMTDLKATVEFLVVKIGNALIPALQSLTTRITDIVGGISKWVTEHKKLTSALIKFAAVLGPLLAAGGALMIFAPAVIRAVTAIKMLSVALVALPALGPIALGITGIALAVAGLVYQVSRFSAQMDTLTAQAFNKRAYQGAGAASEALMKAVGSAGADGKAISVGDPGSITKAGLSKYVSAWDVEGQLVSDKLMAEMKAAGVSTKGYISVTDAAAKIRGRMPQVGASVTKPGLFGGEAGFLPEIGAYYDRGEELPRPMKAGYPSGGIRKPIMERPGFIPSVVSGGGGDALRPLTSRQAGISFLRPPTDRGLAGNVGLGDAGYYKLIKKIREQELDDVRKLNTELAKGFDKVEQETKKFKGIFAGLDIAMEQFTSNAFDFSNAWLDAIYNIKGAISDLFFRMVDPKEKNKWGTFWKDLGNIAIRTLVEIAAAAAVTLIVDTVRAVSGMVSEWREAKKEGATSPGGGGSGGDISIRLGPTPPSMPANMAPSRSGAGSVTYIAQVSFPNANLEGITEAQMERVFRTKLLPAMRTATKTGALNPVMM